MVLCRLFVRTTKLLRATPLVQGHELGRVILLRTIIPFSLLRLRTSGTQRTLPPTRGRPGEAFLTTDPTLKGTILEARLLCRWQRMVWPRNVLLARFRDLPISLWMAPSSLPSLQTLGWQIVLWTLSPPTKWPRTVLVAIILLPCTPQISQLTLPIAPILHLRLPRWIICKEWAQVLVLKLLVQSTSAERPLLPPTLKCTGCPIPLLTPISILQVGITIMLFLRRWTLLRTPFPTTNRQMLTAVTPSLPWISRIPCRSLTLSIFFVWQSVRKIAVKEEREQAFGRIILFTIPTRTAWTSLSARWTLEAGLPAPPRLPQTPPNAPPRQLPVLVTASLPRPMGFTPRTPTALLGETRRWTAPRSVF